MKIASLFGLLCISLRIAAWIGDKSFTANEILTIIGCFAISSAIIICNKN